MAHMKLLLLKMPREVQIVPMTVSMKGTMTNKHSALTKYFCNGDALGTVDGFSVAESHLCSASGKQCKPQDRIQWDKGFLFHNFSLHLCGLFRTTNFQDYQVDSAAVSRSIIKFSTLHQRNCTSIDFAHAAS
mmetsp:Transcript_13217/g.26794  ORF Transcript_13217/g.26794 Transcript_13217/m.26794 type:complete len:132 (-) Transcript_13217:65-460(-)